MIIESPPSSALDQISWNEKSQAKVILYFNPVPFENIYIHTGKSSHM